MRQIVIAVTGTPTDHPTLIVDGQPAVYTADLDTPGVACFTLLPSAGQGWGATVIYAGGRTLRLITPVEDCEHPYDANLPPVRPPEATGTIVLAYASVSRLRPLDWMLVNEAGSRVVLGLSTDFPLFLHFLEDRELGPVVNQRIQAGAQGFRVFGTCGFLFTLDPRMYGPRYYLALDEFATWLEERGLYMQFTAIADGQMLAAGFDQQGHFRHCCDVLSSHTNVVVVEACNENMANGVDAHHWGKPQTSTLVSSGSFCDGWEPTGTWGDLVTFHPRRDWKWSFTIPSTVNELRRYEGQHKPIWIGEPIGAGNHDEPGRRASNPESFQNMAVEIKLWCAGGVYHSEAGLSSALWSETQYLCAESFYRGLRR